jgi:hypothetical protein
VSIQEIYGIFKRFLGDGDTRLAGLILLVGISSFGLGRLSVEEVVPPGEVSGGGGGLVIEATQPTNEARALPPSNSLPDAQDTSEGGYVASKNGTKYHLPWCGSAKQIKEENKVWFSTKAEAEAAGYTPASNCKGI